MNNNALRQDHDFGITTLDTGFMRPFFAASHLLVENQHATYIDTGTSYSVPRLLDALNQKNIPIENVDYVIVTHVHLDHAGGAGKLMHALPNAHLVVHPRGARHMINPTKLIASATTVYGEDTFQALYGDIVPVSAKRVIQPKNGQVIDFKGRPLQFLDTPGHARHHFCIFDERSKSFFTGDAFGISYRDFDTPQGAFIFPATTPVQFEPEAMHDSINCLLSYQPEKMYLTHYGEITDLPRLAEQLHEGIDKQVSLIKSVADKGNPERHTLLSEQMMNYFLQQLQQLGCTLPPEKCRELLATDIELNTQGLEIWWDKK
ncbi:MAG: MBL fold metallo-hydrolase [Candidatus Parabeggiatoa sp. nov. 3]|nr:MAG: MBL fold metallo-hydrolase [Gammaproteobacteria bacterium]RKZ69156.1 MAG: MBL fold metallo-hydrolase [Gammaproteobacteria bacterium]RKZ83304.1 MAG: MBL fold metallo-hydrolase [Gammaproteobacteria bacterium]